MGREALHPRRFWRSVFAPEPAIPPRAWRRHGRGKTAIYGPRFARRAYWPADPAPEVPDPAPPLVDGLDPALPPDAPDPCRVDPLVEDVPLEPPDELVELDDEPDRRPFFMFDLV